MSSAATAGAIAPGREATWFADGKASRFLAAAAYSSRRVACQRRTNRRHPGSPPYRWFHCRARYCRPYAGKSAIPAAGLWPGARLQIGQLRWSLAPVPWEVATPWGRPGRMPFILLGHFTPVHVICFSPIAAGQRTASPSDPSTPPGEENQQRQTRSFPPAGRLSTRREGNGEEHVPDASGLKREGRSPSL